MQRAHLPRQAVCIPTVTSSASTSSQVKWGKPHRILLRIKWGGGECNVKGAESETKVDPITCSSGSPKRIILYRGCMPSVDKALVTFFHNQISV
jgi:hypothetical protein